MLKTIKETILNFLFPIKCVLCGKEKIHCCDTCLDQMTMPKSEPGLPWIKNIFSCAHFGRNSRLASLIHRFKYDGAKEIAELLGPLIKKIPIGRTASERLPRRTEAVFIPVPLHRRRLQWRGFNQSLLLANAYSHYSAIPVADMLERIRYTRPQIELAQEKRLKNVCGAFSLKSQEKLDTSRHYILIDDVMTTGATIGECAKILSRNGAKNISCFVVART